MPSTRAPNHSPAVLLLIDVINRFEAKMGDFELYVPSDCSAARTTKEQRQAIEHIQETADGKVTPSASLRLNEIVRNKRR